MLLNAGARRPPATLAATLRPSPWTSPRAGSPPATLSSRAKLETLRDRSLSARGRAWADGDYLRYRTQLYAKNIKAGRLSGSSFAEHLHSQHP